MAAVELTTAVCHLIVTANLENYDQGRSSLIPLVADAFQQLVRLGELWDFKSGCFKSVDLGNERMRQLAHVFFVEFAGAIAWLGCADHTR